MEFAWIRRLVLMAASTTLALPPPAHAQDPVLRNPDAMRAGADASRTTPEIWVVRGEGSLPEVERIETDLPVELTLAQKSAVLKGLGKILPNAGPWSVTPGEPKVQDRLWLNFREVSSLATNSDPSNTLGNVSSYAIFNPPFQNHGVTLAFTPPTPSRYLVDCRVKKLLASQQYRVTVQPGGAQQTFANSSHLLFVYDAVQTEDAWFTVQAVGQPAWQFYGCEVTPIQP
jgi:hypothetical protein